MSIYSKPSSLTSNQSVVLKGLISLRLELFLPPGLQIGPLSQLIHDIPLDIDFICYINDGLNSEYFGDAIDLSEELVLGSVDFFKLP